jgi:hypothetical protein
MDGSLTTRPVSSCGAESTVNCLINHRMNKRQQMRWSRRGADLLLQVRAAVLNGEFDALLRPGSVSQAANEDQHDLLPLAALPPGFERSLIRNCNSLKQAHFLSGTFRTFCTP